MCDFVQLKKTSFYQKSSFHAGKDYDFVTQLSIEEI